MISLHNLFVAGFIGSPQMNFLDAKALNLVVMLFYYLETQLFFMRKKLKTY
jgi:ABC-type sugar transport system ATPase subunit